MNLVGDPLIDAMRRDLERHRFVLALVPEQEFDWRPAPDVMSLGSLAAHLAEIPKWTLALLNAESYDHAESAVRNPERAKTGAPAALADRSALLAAFDANAARALEALGAVTDDQLAEPFTILRAGAPLEVLNRAGAVRCYVLDHMIHHRAQLTVYLRMLGLAVPGLYGPSAAERKPR